MGVELFSALPRYSLSYRVNMTLLWQRYDTEMKI
jgi:hypothetical protein